MLHLNWLLAQPRMPVRRALVLGTLTVGTLDILDALLYYGRLGVAPIRIFQSIASGLLGRPAYSGGLPTALLGGALHYCIAFGVVGTLLVSAHRWRALARTPWLVGPVYGVLVYGVMNFIVLPLSAAVVGRPNLPAVINGLAIHVVGVGLPSALFAGAATPPREEKAV